MLGTIYFLYFLFTLLLQAAADVCKHPKEAYLVYVDGHLAEGVLWFL